MDRNGQKYRLLVDTNTNSWRFKVLHDDATVGEATCVQDGEVLSLLSFQIHDGVPIREGVLAGTWRKIIGGDPKLVNFRGIGLGRSLLRFIIRRAREFVATQILTDLGASDLNGEHPVSNWFQRQGFQAEASPDGSPSSRARLILVEESSDDITLHRDVKPKRPKARVGLTGSRRSGMVKGVKTPVVRLRKVISTARKAGFTKDSLAKLFRPVSDLINRKIDDVDELLDPAIRDRLKASNTVIHHGGYTRVLQYHIWDRDQPSIFHRHHFKYEVQYDPAGTKAGTATTNFCIHFYLNKFRLYHEREEMVARVRLELSKIRLPGFKLKETERAFSFHHNFHATNPAELMAEVRKYLFPLLNGVHPMFYRIMDAFNVPMTKAQRRAVISGREKLSFVDRNSPNYGKNQEFRREVPRHFRTATFQRDKHTCQHCERKFAVAMLHADHVMPIARGGLTTLGNLQTLCGPCNLRKGKRLEAEL